MPNRLACALTCLAAVAAGGGAVCAESRATQLTVGVIVLRSCTVDARPAIGDAPALRLSCTSGAHSHVRVLQSQTSGAAAVSPDVQVVTLNF